MPLFKVTLECSMPKHGPMWNPFHPNAMMGTTRVALRSWEFEAADEAEVERLYQEAMQAKLPQVVGFAIRNIQRVTRPAAGTEAE